MTNRAPNGTQREDPSPPETTPLNPDNDAQPAHEQTRQSIRRNREPTTTEPLLSNIRVPDKPASSTRDDDAPSSASNATGTREKTLAQLDHRDKDATGGRVDRRPLDRVRAPRTAHRTDGQQFVPNHKTTRTPRRGRR